MSMLFDLINDVKSPENKELEDIEIIPSSGRVTQSSDKQPMWADTGPIRHVNATDSAKRAYNYYIGKGHNPKVAAGVVGNLFKESGLNPKAVGDGGTSEGIAQWHKERLNGLKKYAQKKGKHYQDLNTQLDYAVEEMPNVIRKMGNASNERQASNIFTDEFERPNPKYADKGTRTGMASSLVKMAYGGKIKKAKFGLDEGQALGSGLNLIGAFTEGFDTNKNYSDRTLSTVGGLLKGAGQGASIGTMIGGPGIGTAIGAGIGAIAGGISGKAKAKKEKELYDNKMSANSSAFMDGMSLRASNYLSKGTSNLRYGRGGKLKNHGN